MTQSPMPLVPQTPFGRLRPIKHPELSELLTHFCHRGRDPGSDVPAEICRMTAQERLTSILWGGHLGAFETFWGGYPAVCFTEARLPGLDYLIRERGYQPWGLMFDRQSVFNAGGGPVWHARPDLYETLKEALDPRFRSWAVRLGNGSDWLEEREWRIVRAPHASWTAVALTELGLVGLLVGDPGWTGVQWAWRPSAATGQYQWGNFFPPLPSGLPRFWWDPSSARLQPLPPLF